MDAQILDNKEKTCVNPGSGLIPDTTSRPPAIDVQS